MKRALVFGIIIPIVGGMIKFMFDYLGQTQDIYSPYTNSSYISIGDSNPIAISNGGNAYSGSKTVIKEHGNGRSIESTSYANSESNTNNQTFTTSSNASNGIIEDDVHRELIFQQKRLTQEQYERELELAKMQLDLAKKLAQQKFELGKQAIEFEKNLGKHISQLNNMWE